MAPLVAMPQRRDFKVLGSSPEQNGFEIGVEKYHVTELPAKLMTCGM